MVGAGLRYYYKNVTCGAVGDDCCIIDEQFAQLETTFSSAISQINKNRNDNLAPFRDLPYNQYTLESVNSIAREFRKGCRRFVVVGIERSLLGHLAIENLVKNLASDNNSEQPELFFIETTSGLAEFLKTHQNELESARFNFIATSQNSAVSQPTFIETFNLLEKKYSQKHAQASIVVTAGFNDEITKLATQEYGCKNLVLPNNLDVKYDLLSASVLLSFCVCGYDIEQILSGARAMDTKVSGESFYKNPAAINAAVIWFFCNKTNTEVFLNTLDSKAEIFAKWYGEVMRESMNIEISPKANSGDGQTNFAGNVLLDTVFCCGELKPSAQLIVEELDLFAIGQLIYFCEVSVSIAKELSKSKFDTSKPQDLGSSKQFEKTAQHEIDDKYLV